MTQLEISYPDGLCIPIEPPTGDPGPWLDETAASFGLARDLDADGVERVRAALQGLVGLVDPTSRLLLMVAPNAAGFAPLRITISDAALTPSEQAEFLWSRDAILPPTAELVETGSLGPGITVALLQRHGGLQFATRRWLFPGANGAVGILLGPVPPYGLALLQPGADAVVEHLQVAGFVPTEDRAELERFEAAAARSGEAWAQ